MAGYSDPLSYVKIAAPCSADWDQMIGTEQVRFCGQCKLNVYNLSGMTKNEAEALVVRTEGRLCVRFYRRADGTILTNNCPVGLRAIKRRMSRLIRATASTLLSFFAGLGVYAAFGQGRASIAMDDETPFVITGTMITKEDVVPPVDMIDVKKPSDGRWANGRMASMPAIAGQMALLPHQNESYKAGRVWRRHK